MIRKDNRGTVSLSKRGWIILFGSVLAVALAAWIILVAGIFRNKNRNDKDKKYDIPEIPEGYALVFREKKHYSISKNGKRRLKYDCEYDELGMLITKTYYSEGAEISQRVQYTYDDHGNVIRQTMYDCDRNIIVSDIENKYDSEGRLMERCSGNKIQTFNENGDPLTEYSIDGNGVSHIVEERTYTEDGRLLAATGSEYTTVYFYDNSGKKERIEQRVYGSLYFEEIFLTEYTSESYRLPDDGVRYLCARNEYDKNGNVTHTTSYNEDGTVAGDKITEWDEYGFPVKIISYNNGNFTFWFEYEYDEASRMYKHPSKTTSKNADGMIQYYTVDRYLPEMGNIESMTYNADGSVKKDGSASLFYCETDSYGNPIRCIYWEDGVESVSDETEFIPMAIPKEYMNDYDRYEKK